MSEVTGGSRPDSRSAGADAIARGAPGISAPRGRVGRDPRIRESPTLDTDVKLVAKLKAGGAGAWGAIPMPDQRQVGAADAEAVIQWILAGAP